MVALTAVSNALGVDDRGLADSQDQGQGQEKDLSNHFDDQLLSTQASK